MYILQISRHSPESCAMFNEEAKNVMVTLLKNMDEILGRHGIKMVGSWTNAPSHTIYSIYETPSVEAYMGLYKEPVFLAWLKHHKVSEQVVTSLEEGKTMLGL